MDYEKYKKLIFKLAHRHSKASSLPFDELVSEGNMAFVEAVASYKPEVSSFSTHLYTYANQRMRNYAKSCYRRGEKMGALPDHFSSSENVEKQARLHIALSELADDAKDVVEIIFNTPLDLIESLRTETYTTLKVTAIALRRYLALRGWGNKRIGLAMGEIKNALKTI